MFSYIKNKRRSEKLISMLSLLFWIINFVFLEVSVNMFSKIISAGKSSWFYKAARQEMSTDPLFADRIDTVMDTLVIVLVIVIIFSVGTIILFSKIQLKNMLTQMGMYFVLGYNKRRVFDICMTDITVDMAAAFPVSLIISTLSWNRIMEMKMIGRLLQLMDNNIWLDGANYIMCAGVMFLVAVVYTKIFIEISTRKGISYMLGKGVV